jgi:hypothetical protein
MATTKRLCDVGWAWDGQAITGSVKLSIFGAGGGTRWFGLRRCCHMFHENNALALEQFTDMAEVVCEISKWDYEVVTDHPVHRGLGSPMRNVHDGRIERKVAEADNVGRLSLAFPNLTGIYDDDLLGKIKTEHLTAEQYAKVRAAARAHNPALKLWAVVYTHELNPADWQGFQPILDVINLWVWKSADLVRLDDDLARCREIFPGKPIVMGCYLRDFTLGAGVPMDRLRLQWEKVAAYLDRDLIAGFNILGGFLIDTHAEQARWVRDFIAAH